MSAMRGAGALAHAYLRETWRAKPIVFWNVAFPILTLLLFSFIFGGGQPAGVARVLPGIVTINLLAAAFFGVSLHMVSLRERQVYRRFSVTPLSGMAVVLAHAAAALLNIVISFALQLLLARAVFRLAIRASILELALVALIGAFAFIPLGLLVGSVGRDMRTAPAISNLLFFPLSFLSGATLPLAFMPPWVQKVATLLPSTYFLDLLQAALLRGQPFQRAGFSAGLLVVTGIVAFALNALLFRWETTQPLSRKGLGISIGMLAAIYGGAFLYGVRLESARAPQDTRTRAANAGPDTRVLYGMTVIDGRGGRIARAQITIRGKRIVSVGPAEGLPPEGDAVIDLSGSYVMPGLVDSHVHLGGSAGGSVAVEEFVPQRLRHDLQAYLAFGVTAVVSLTDHVEDMQNLQHAVADGSMRAPRVYLSGPGITAVGGHPARLFSFLPGFPEYMTRQVTSADAAERATAELASMHVDIVKLFLEGGWPGQPLPVLSEPALRAAIRAAHDRSLKTTVHVDNDQHARLAIDAGTDGIEHVPPDLTSSTVDALVARHVTLTPTLAVGESITQLLTGTFVEDSIARGWVENPVRESLTASDSWIAKVRASPASVDYYVKRFQASRRALRQAVAGKVIIVAGSDAGNAGVFHGVSLIRELELLVDDGGMSPRAAIQAATGVAARRLGVTDIGTIAPGTFADLVVVDRDPEADIRALRAVRAVYFGGVELQRGALLQSDPGNWTPAFSFPALNAPKDKQ